MTATETASGETQRDGQWACVITEAGFAIGGGSRSHGNQLELMSTKRL